MTTTYQDVLNPLVQTLSLGSTARVDINSIFGRAVQEALASSSRARLAP